MERWPERGAPKPRVESFERAILPHLNAAHNLARWLAGNDHDAQDIVQEAFLRAFRFFDTYRGGDGKAWLLQIVRNTSRTWRSREVRRGAVVPFDETAHGALESPRHEDALAAGEQMVTLEGCIEALPAEFREVLVLRELEELSYKEIAEVAGVAIGTVMSRLARARKRLEDCAKGRSQGAAR